MIHEYACFHQKVTQDTTQQQNIHYFYYYFFCSWSFVLQSRHSVLFVLLLNKRNALWVSPLRMERDTHSLVIHAHLPTIYILVQRSAYGLIMGLEWMQKVTCFGIMTTAHLGRSLANAFVYCMFAVVTEEDFSYSIE